MLYTQREVKKLGTILGIWAHPDDEIFSCAGLMHAACLNGQKVISITATFGDAGESADEKKWPKADLGKIRKKESEKAIELLGNINQHWLGYSDGNLKTVGCDEAVEKIVNLIKQEKIDTIITFEEQGITGHYDHIAVYEWSVLLAKKLSVNRVLCSIESEEFYNSHGKELHKKHNIYFNVDKPNYVCKADADVYFELSEEIKNTKIEALKTHASQTAGLFKDSFSMQAIVAMSSCESFVLDKLNGEIK